MQTDLCPRLPHDIPVLDGLWGVQLQGKRLQEMGNDMQCNGSTAGPARYE